MLRLLTLILVTQATLPTRTAYVTKTGGLVASLDRFYEELEKLTVAPTQPKPTTEPPLSDDEEELLSAMQAWGRLTPEQINSVAKDLRSQRISEDDRMDDYGELDDEEYTDILNDGNEDEEDDDERITPKFMGEDSVLAKSRGDIDLGWRDVKDDASYMDEEETSSAPLHGGVTPSAYTKDEPGLTVLSAVNPIAATKERPRVIDESALTALDRKALKEAAMENTRRVLNAANCLTPQPRWLSVRQLIPSSDTMFIPPCVELHRCAPDTGCCHDEAKVCAPVDGRYVAIPFYLHKATGQMSVARVVFFNHTQCECVSQETLQSSQHLPPSRHPVAVEASLAMNDWRPAQGPTVAPVIDDDVTAPPQMRRCTCPAYFLAATSDKGACTCACDWRDATRRRECQFFSRGKEHVGLRDRVCIDSGDCAPPVCEYGSYERTKGRCPIRKFKRLRYNVRRHQYKNV